MAIELTDKKPAPWTSEINTPDSVPLSNLYNLLKDKVIGRPWLTRTMKRGSAVIFDGSHEVFSPNIKDNVSFTRQYADYCEFITIDKSYDKEGNEVFDMYHQISGNDRSMITGESLKPDLSHHRSELAFNVGNRLLKYISTVFS